MDIQLVKGSLAFYTLIGLGICLGIWGLCLLLKGITILVKRCTHQTVDYTDDPVTSLNSGPTDDDDDCDDGTDDANEFDDDDETTYIEPDDPDAKKSEDKLTPRPKETTVVHKPVAVHYPRQSPYRRALAEKRFLRKFLRIKLRRRFRRYLQARSISLPEYYSARLSPSGKYDL